MTLNRNPTVAELLEQIIFAGVALTTVAIEHRGDRPLTSRFRSGGSWWCSADHPPDSGSARSRAASA